MVNRKGFTLLEVLIAMTIMAFLSLYTAESIRRGVQTKVKIQSKIDQQAALLDALSIISKDVQTAFNYRDINIIAYNNAQKARQKRDLEKKNNPKKPDDDGNPGDPPKPPTPNPADAANDAEKYKLKEEVILTQFIGSENELHFTSLSHLRRKKNDPTSDQAEVGYFTKKCKGRMDKKQSSDCLWRRISPHIDDDVTKGGSEIVLLENVEEFRLRYLGPQREKEWVKNWKSDKNGDDITKDHFPYAVEITLSVKDPKKEKSTLSMTAIAPIRFSNNPVEKDENNNSETNSSAEGTGDENN